MDAAAVEQLFKRLPGLRPDEVPTEVELTELRAAAMDCAHDGEAAVVVQLDVPQLERLQRAEAAKVKRDELKAEWKAKTEKEQAERE